MKVINQTRTTNILLLIIVIPLVFFLLKKLSFIFIPLVSSMFIALIFVPIMRWLTKKGLKKSVSIGIVLIIIVLSLWIGVELIQLSSREILATQDEFMLKAENKIRALFAYLNEVTGMELVKENEPILSSLLPKDQAASQIGNIVKLLGGSLSSALMTFFFVVLWLAESINFQKLLHQALLKSKLSSIKAFRKIESDLIKFMKVKFALSLFTGIGIGLACYAFDVSFPIFWGLFAFVINFVQMIGSFISVIMVSIFAFVELDPSSALFFFMLSCTLVQVLFGGILEPVFMGKSFSINIITVLIMLMLWGYIWGVPGMILSIPITVFIKIIFEQFRSTQLIAHIISAKDDYPEKHEREV
ncbi:AI-2E family transporter [Crocinitomix algicola]|uniref:AI-2E family transporter n=1 Tax=Crocinitomix algicola TaxID=1740263 RepID=UPI0009F4CD72|nr:AI-2E family transporter [Crocinitomix algicola]